jgi:hypothetical protein
MVTVPEAWPSSPAAAVSWQPSCQPGREQSSGPVPLSIRSCRWPAWVTTPVPCYRRPSLLTRLEDSNGDRYSENVHL